MNLSVLDEMPKRNSKPDDIVPPKVEEPVKGKASLPVKVPAKDAPADTTPVKQDPKKPEPKKEKPKPQKITLGSVQSFMSSKEEKPLPIKEDKPKELKPAEEKKKEPKGPAWSSVNTQPKKSLAEIQAEEQKQKPVLQNKPTPSPSKAPQQIPLKWTSNPPQKSPTKPITILPQSSNYPPLGTSASPQKDQLWQQQAKPSPEKKSFAAIQNEQAEIERKKREKAVVKNFR
jgi:translation initiation factor IF-2